MKINSENQQTTDLTDLIKKISTPLNNPSDLDPLMNYIGDANYVLLGEASHGTHEYYTWRAKITKRLIQEKGFSFIAVEGDWPDCYRLNRYIKNYEMPQKTAEEVLSGFNRWPTWMWANWEIVALAEWLKNYNTAFPVNKKIGFYGLDVYSLWESMEGIIGYLKDHDEDTLSTAFKAIHCFEPFNQDEGQTYARASRIIPELCEKAVVRLLAEIRKNIEHYNSDYENVLSTEQNAHIAVNAEKYYRAMIKGGPESWNIRDRHMVATLNRLMNFHGKAAKVIVWEHNTHIGDARATDMASEGMVNVGQLVTEKFSNEGVVLVGFGSYQGSVIAGRDWGDDMRKIPVPPAIKGSWENILHNAGGHENKLLMFDKVKNEEKLGTHIPHRAIGVVYHPEREQYGNYVPSILPMRYDAFIYLDHTKALFPLKIITDTHQIPETFPFGI